MGIVMAKKRMGRPPKGRNDVTARIDADALRKVKVVAGLLGKTVAEYLTEITTPIIDRDLKRLAGKLMSGDKTEE